jgi:ligand-binding SRPBCC domain-containing protein
MMRALVREQWLPVALDGAWHFFSSPDNLSKITPGDMGFRIREPFDRAPIHTGQRITYTVKPLFGIPLTWITCIAVAEPPHRFVDVQIKGPYKHWWHEHTFEERDGGTLMRDRVEYEMPLGPLGELVHGWLVRDRLRRIFDHRFRTLAELFPGTSLRPVA